MTLSVYCCGGTGVNIGKQLTDLDYQVNFIDTSKSNLKSLNSKNIHEVEEMDGAGKVRADAYNKLKDSDTASNVLIKFKPSDQLNIVIGSLSGGSGSVISPLITRELLLQNKPTIVIALESKNSLIEMENSVRTLQSFKSISDSLKQPLNIYHLENHTRREADFYAISFINTMALLIDKSRTEEFDTSDLKSFLNFHKVTDNIPTTSILEIARNETIVPEKGTSIVGSILMAKDRSTVLSPVAPEYMAMCVVTDPDYKEEDVRINSVLGKLAIIIDNMQTSIQSMRDNKKVNRVRDVEITNTTQSDGMVI